jgi:hypothetical protein
MLTVSSIKADLHDDFPVDDAKFLRLLQQADTRLLELGRWRWTRDRITLTITTDANDDLIVTLSPEYVSILAVQLDGSGGDIRDEDFEFVVGGVGYVQSADGAVQLIDNGYLDVTDGNTTERRRVYKVTGGANAVGDALVALAQFAPVVLYDPDLLDDTDSGSDNDTPTDGTDVTRCQSLAALKLCMFGITYENSGDAGRARAFMADAHHVLDNKQTAHRGGARQQATTRQPGISSVSGFY